MCLISKTTVVSTSQDLRSPQTLIPSCNMASNTIGKQLVTFKGLTTIVLVGTFSWKITIIVHRLLPGKTIDNFLSRRKKSQPARRKLLTQFQLDFSIFYTQSVWHFQQKNLTIQFGNACVVFRASESSLTITAHEEVSLPWTWDFVNIWLLGAVLSVYSCRVNLQRPPPLEILSGVLLTFHIYK